MPIKLFISAIIVTLVTALPAYFLISPELQLTSSNLPYILLLVFIISLASAWLGARVTSPGAAARRSPRQKTVNQPAPASGNRESGSVKWFNASKGFGFITRDTGDDIFVHFRSIRGEGHRILRDGQRVEFAVSQGDKGLQADDVVPAG